jgi:hypothetical protein
MSNIIIVIIITIFIVIITIITYQPQPPHRLPFHRLG